MQRIKMTAFSIILLYLTKISLSKDAKGTFDNDNCAWREVHLSGSQRGFNVSCCKPKVHCQYQGDPHKCKKFYVIDKKVMAFYHCLAKDSLDNAENACSKSMVQCYKECDETANFHKVNSRYRRASVQEEGERQQCPFSSQDDDSFDLAKLGEYIKRPVVIVSIAGGVMFLLLISCTIICCKRR